MSAGNEPTAYDMLCRIHDEIVWFINAFSSGRLIDSDTEGIAHFILTELMEHLESKDLGDPRRRLDAGMKKLLDARADKKKAKKKTVKKAPTQKRSLETV